MPKEKPLVNFSGAFEPGELWSQNGAASTFQIQASAPISDHRRSRTQSKVSDHHHQNLCLCPSLSNCSLWKHFRKENARRRSNFIAEFRFSFPIDLRFLFSFVFIAICFLRLTKQIHSRCLSAETEANRGRIREEVTGITDRIIFLQ